MDLFFLLCSQFRISCSDLDYDNTKICFLQFHFRYAPSGTVAEILQAAFRVNRLLSTINAVVPRDIEPRIKTNLECRPFR